MSNGHGGVRKGAGRPPKADELKLIEKLKPLDDLAFAAIKAGVEKKDYKYLRLFMDYRFGKPKEQVKITGKEEDEFDYSQLSNEEIDTLLAITNKYTAQQAEGDQSE